ncbi:hypothetical protein INR49_020771 [Caranx melampygus]|nr:hypothetical protein INR49_020771 [Caranx melampygus]
MNSEDVEEPRGSFSYLNISPGHGSWAETATPEVTPGASRGGSCSWCSLSFYHSWFYWSRPDPGGAGELCSAGSLDIHEPCAVSLTS